MTPLEAPTEDGGWMPEPAPPGELCSGKLGEFSQALRADSIFGGKGKEGRDENYYRRPWAARVQASRVCGADKWALTSFGLALPSE